MKYNFDCSNKIATLKWIWKKGLSTKTRALVGKLSFGVVMVDGGISGIKIHLMSKCD